MLGALSVPCAVTVGWTHLDTKYASTEATFLDRVDHFLLDLEVEGKHLSQQGVWYHFNQL